MNFINPDLFRWKQQTGKSLHPSYEKSNIHKWMKHVHAQSDEAVREAYGSDVLGRSETFADDEAEFEAQELLDSWLKKRSSSFDPEEHMFPSRLDDNGLDSRALLMAEEHLEVEDLDEENEVQGILGEMLSKPVVTSQLMKQLTADSRLVTADPRPRIELRHKQVKEKAAVLRKEKEAERQESVKMNEIQQQARLQLVNEEKGRKARAKEEEKRLHHEMALVRKEMEEEKRLAREEQQRKNVVLQQARQQLEDEIRSQKAAQERETLRRHQAHIEMKQAVARQLEEQSLEEIRRKFQTLHQCFATWRRVVLDRRVQAGKIRVVHEWKLKLKVWNSWKAYIACVKTDKEAQAAEMLMKERYRKEQMALQHWQRHMLKKGFTGWRVWHLRQQTKRDLKLKHQEHAIKMAIFLEAASKGLLWKRDGERNAMNKQNQIGDLRDRRGSNSTDSSARLESLEGVYLNQKGVDDRQVLSSCEAVRQSSAKVPTAFINLDVQAQTTSAACTPHKGPPVPLFPLADVKSDDVSSDCSSSLTQRSAVATSRSEVSGCLAASTTHVLNLDSDRKHPSSLVRAQGAPRKSLIKSEKPATKPLRLAMEERAQLRAIRKAAVEEQKRQRDEERLQQLRQAEAERLQREEEEKQERIRLKKEQDRLQKERELEKLRRLEEIQVQNSMAQRHHERALVRRFGLCPWKRLVQVARLNEKIADKFRHGMLLGCAFREWYRVIRSDISAKETIADTCCERILAKRAMRSWKKFRGNSRRMVEVATLHCKNACLKRAFGAWQDHVTDERILMMAKESDADEHNQWRLIKGCLRDWREFVRHAKEERLREIRRDELREKVRNWLPDYAGGKPVS